MSDNALIENPTDEEEIIDLLEVVTVGKSVPSDSSDSDTVDFSQHIDSMMEELAKHEGAEDESEKTEDLPFPDPTPVDHEVDPNEELPMPSMEDIDNLLESLGATAEEVAPTETKPESQGDDLDFDLPAEPVESKTIQETPTSQTSEAEDTISVDLEDLPFTSPETAINTPTEIPAEPEPTTQVEASVAPPAEAQTQAPAENQAEIPAEPEPTTQVEASVAPSAEAQTQAPAENQAETPAEKEPTTQAEASVTQEEVIEDDATEISANTDSQEEEEEEEEEEEVDLNKLDALLDDVLASAPPSGDSLKKADQKSKKSVDSISMDTKDTPTYELMEAIRNEISEQMKTIALLKKTIETQANEIQKLHSFLTENNLLNRLTSLEHDLDKKVSEAAAKVIREEITSLLDSVEK